MERFLVDQAREHSPDFVAKTAKHAVAVLDPDGTLPSEKDQQRLRGLSFSLHPDGSSDIRGYLTPACTATVLAVLDPLAKPAAADQDTPDPRTAAQRMHDALLDAGTRLLRSDTLPHSGGVPATVLLTMTLTDLETRLGVATTSHGGHLTIPAALRLAADADIIPVVMNDAGGIAAYGRSKRHATKKQRHALAARDGGCSFPGCDTPPEWCDSHHIIHWRDNGWTDLDNLTLVCGFHHREHEKQGWECHMTDGVPLWTPPWWIDTNRTPRRNTAHHTPRYLAAQAA